ncbi:cytochrome P450 71A1-like [Ananas comosus]|uniref:Cytochrome P450 71A1-like n=1 Tax=Ananas comosus TaxID=4615 RepID=A0A6P5GNA5_ANACO|nr:cytochrome P450 71A1-like [Ananas comosus]
MEISDPLTFLSLLLVVVALFSSLYIIPSRRSDGRRRRLPPSPPSLPVIGHLHLLSAMPHHSLAALSARLGAPLLYLRLGRVPAAVVSSPALARAALTAADAALASRPDLLSARVLSFGRSDVTFAPAGPYHRQARRIVVSELLSPRGAPIDMSARLFGLANDVLCRVAFGRRFGGGGGGGGERLVEVLTEAQALFAGFTVGDFFPEIEWAISTATGLRRRMNRCLAGLRAVCDEIIADHKGEGGGAARDGYSQEDFVDVLLRVQRSPELEVPITDDNLKALVLDMFVAGTDTSFATLEWVMTELAKHPNTMRKAQEEVRRIVGNKGRVEEGDLQQLNYMRAVVKETFRLHPPVPLLVPRESVEKCTLGGYDIPAKTRVFINTYAIGRDPQVWENPLDFSPERFRNTDIDLKGQDFELLPFGGGRRGCPGYSFALATIENALSSLLYHFDWELPPGVGADDVDMTEIFGLATRKKEPLILIAKTHEGYEFKETN